MIFNAHKILVYTRVVRNFPTEALGIVTLTLSYMSVNFNSVKFSHEKWNNTVHLTLGGIIYLVTHFNHYNGSLLASDLCNRNTRSWSRQQRWGGWVWLLGLTLNYFIVIRQPLEQRQDCQLHRRMISKSVSTNIFNSEIQIF